MTSHTTNRPATRRWTAIAFWAAVCLPPLVIYARTMAPGLLVRGDTPKFQYLGAILGTAHSPGYPLYVQLSWLFSQLPFETVAWRVNLMTMLFGVAAVALVAGTALRLGAGRGGALMAAWGLGFGRVFWEQTSSAEVYTLSTIFQAASLGLALRWQQTRRTRDLLAAVGVAALALGHHPTIVMTVPGLVLFVLLVDWRVLRRPATIAASLALVALGLAQYLFIMLRTTQRAAYVEAHASSFEELTLVLRGKQYAENLFAYSLGDLFDSRFRVVGGFVLQELTAVGLLLALAGVVVLVRRNWRASAMLLLGAVIVFAFGLSYDVPDIQVFVIPVFVVLWLFAGMGLAGLAQALIGPPARRAMVTTACAAAFATVAVARSYAAEDLSGESFDAEYFEAMMNQIDKPAAVYFEHENTVGHALRYQILVERKDVGGGRVAFVSERPDLRTAYTSRPGNYAIHPNQWLLEARGLLLSPVTLEASLLRRLRELPASARVAIAIPPGIASNLAADDIAFFRGVGIDRLSASAGLAAIAQRGRLVAIDVSGERATALADVGVELASHVDGARAEVLVDGRAVATGDDAALVVAIDPPGRVLWSVEINRARGVVPSLDMGRRPLYRVVGTSPCDTTTAGAWARFDGPAILGPRLTAWVPSPPGRTAAAEGTVVVYAGGNETPLNFYGITTEGTDVGPSIEGFDTTVPADAERLAHRLAADQQTSPLGTRFVARVEFPLRRRESSEMSGVLTAAPRPDVMFARLTAADDSAVRFCSSPVHGAVLFDDPHQLQVDLLRAHQEFVGSGWSSSFDLDDRRVRRATAGRSAVQLTIREPLPLVMRVQAQPGSRTSTGTIRIEVNGHLLEAHPLAPEPTEYEWRVPAALWNAGYNRVVVIGAEGTSPPGPGEAPRASAEGGLIVRSIFVAREMR